MLSSTCGDYNHFRRDPSEKNLWLAGKGMRDEVLVVCSGERIDCVRVLR